MKPRRNPAGKVTGFEPRDDFVPDDPGRHSISQDALKSVPHFDADFPVAGYHQQEHAVVRPLSPKFPGSGHSVRKLFERLSLQ